MPEDEGRVTPREPADSSAAPFGVIRDGDSIDVAVGGEDSGATATTTAASRPWIRTRVLRIIMAILAALIGASLGVLIGGQTTADIGPLRASANLILGPGDTTVRIPPLGALQVDAFAAPVHLELTVLTVDPKAAAAYVGGSKTMNQLTAEVESDLKAALTSLAIKTVIWALVGAVVAWLLIFGFRRFSYLAISAGMTLVLIAGVAGIGYLTFDVKALEKPSYTGPLAQAPALIGDVENLEQKFADYRKSLVKMVTNVSKLYAAVSTLPSDPDLGDVVKVLHISDIHMNPSGFDLASNLVTQFGVDIVVDTGDIVDWGTSQEAHTFTTLSQLTVPYIYVRGNHDSMTTQQQVGAFPNVTVLDNSEVTIDGITFAGVGDPRFSPDRTTYNDASLDKAVTVSATNFAKYLDGLSEPPDVILFHDPAGAPELSGSAPLILSGHRHKRNLKVFDDTVVMTQGSTGGAGLRGLEGEEPTPLTASILYFNRETAELTAWDEVTLGGLGETDVSIVRKLDPQAEQAAEESAATITSPGTDGRPADGSDGPAGDDPPDDPAQEPVPTE